MLNAAPESGRGDVGGSSPHGPTIVFGLLATCTSLSHAWRMTFRKQTQVSVENNELSDTTSHANQKLRKHEDCRPIYVIQPREVDGNFRAEPVEVL